MKYRGVICHDTEEWCQFWRKTDLLFQKWQKFGEFWSEPSKLLKICTLIGPFCTKYIIFDPKKYRGVIYHDTQESSKFEEKLTCGFENDTKNSSNFHQHTWKCQNYYFDRGILSKVEHEWTKTL